MNTVAQFMSDAPLSDEQNFDVLKAKGIDFIKSIAGYKWSNYNESDPGVTILDQVCYALTELGYCENFSIEDVLTDFNGKISYKSQFFDPQSILTSSPVTIDDYRKLVVDKFPEVNNIYFYIERGHGDTATGIYSSYIYLNAELLVTDGITSCDEKKIAADVHDTLMCSRNVGEVFLSPKILKNKEIIVNGKVILSDNALAHQVYARMRNVIKNYTSPVLKQAGYQELVNEGYSADSIFNGPQLQRGWIVGKAVMADKRNSIRKMDIASAIAGIDGVVGVELISLSLPSAPDKSLETIDISIEEVADIQLSAAFQLLGGENSTKSANEQQVAADLSLLKVNHQSSSVQAEIDSAPQPPQGRFRDIEKYYSIQNTFPDIYAVGPNSLHSDTENYRVAQSRQLKAYLMIYDQILANQFSQLAHIGDLFSFASNNAIDERWHFSDPNISFKRFAATYYYQPLYDVPDVKPLLSGNDSHLYQFDPDKKRSSVERKSWKKYREDKFNQYIYSLRHSIENTYEAEHRRNMMLTHLMARHADNASDYEDIIKTCQWYGSDLKTLIIVKCIWLQNTQELSYYRNKAYDCNKADKLARPGRFSINRDELLRLLRKIDENPELNTQLSDEHNLKREIENLLNSRTIDAAGLGKLREYVPIVDKYKKLITLWRRRTYFPTIDGQLDQEKIFNDARLNRHDFDNYSAFELKLGIVLNLQQHLLRIAAMLVALLNENGFGKWLKQNNATNGVYRLPESDVKIERVSGKDRVFEGETCLLEIVSPQVSNTNVPPDFNVYQEHINQLLWLGEQRKGFVLLENILLRDPGVEVSQMSSAYFLQISLVFPGYVTFFQNSNFKKMIARLLALHLPAHLSVKSFYVPFASMSKFIKNFCIWHDGLVSGEGLAQSCEVHHFSKFREQNGEVAAAANWRNAARTLAQMLGLPISQGGAHNGK